MPLCRYPAFVAAAAAATTGGAPQPKAASAEAEEFPAGGFPNSNGAVYVCVTWARWWYRGCERMYKSQRPGLRGDQHTHSPSIHALPNPSHARITRRKGGEARKAGDASKRREGWRCFCILVVVILKQEVHPPTCVFAWVAGCV